MKIPHPEYYYRAGKLGTEFDGKLLRAYRHLGKRFKEAERSTPLNQPLHINFEHDDKEIQGLCAALVRGDFHAPIAGVFETFRTSETAKVFRVNPEFLWAMKRMDVDIKSELLPEPGFIAYFSFQKGVLVDMDGDDIVGAYVHFKEVDSDTFIRICYVTPAPKTGAAIKTDKGEVVVKKQTFGNYGWLYMRIKAETKFSDLIDELKNAPGARFNREVGKNANENIFRTCLNLSMYVHSLNPDVSELRPRREMTKRELKNSSRLNELRCEVYPVVLLNWSYGRDRTYTVDATIRSAHLRWQRCGPGRSQTKLIIVREHEVTYKNVAHQSISSTATSAPPTGVSQ